MNNSDVKARYNNSIKIKYGVDSIWQSDEIKDKRADTLMRRYNVTNPNSNPDIMKKTRETFLHTLSKEGIVNVSQRPDVMNKIITTHNTLYGGMGTGSHIISDRIYNTLSGKYGIDISNASDAWTAINNDPTVQDKGRTTCQAKYGADSHMQSPAVLARILSSRYTQKHYTMPSGRIVTCMGYEPRCIHELLIAGYHEDDIVVGITDMAPYIGTIMWIDPTDNTTHRYFPDVYIKSKNNIIEVKSTYTYHANYIQNIAKRDACLASGFNFEFVIYDNGNY